MPDQPRARLKTAAPGRQAGGMTTDGQDRARARTGRLALAAAALWLAGPVAVGAQPAAPSEPLPIRIRAPEPEPRPTPSKSRLEQLLARREEAARRWQIGICRGCSQSEGALPAGRMIEVSTTRPRASWETTVPAPGPAPAPAPSAASGP
jgi:hypothetical protein